MLVIFGANGRTGLALYQLARERGMAVRPVVRDDRDTAHLDGTIAVQDVYYADPEQYESLAHTLEGATAVISCIDPRTAGPGAPIYTERAAANVLRAAQESGAARAVHLSIMGAYRWSYASLNRKSFYLENGVRQSPADWGILRISCYHDEIIEGYVRPPDGGAPATFQPASRYAPVSRRDGAGMALAFLERYKPGRAQPAGGPKAWTGVELERLLSPLRQGSGRTAYKKLPPGDVSVDPETTLRVLGYIPSDTLEAALARMETPEPSADVRTVYPSGDPPAHPADRGEDGVTAGWGGDLRRVVHAQLVEDLARLGEPTEGVTLDFSAAAPGPRSVDVHGGTFTELRGVRAVGPDGEAIRSGDVDFLRDNLAEEFHCWWRRDTLLPPHVWNQLDLGVLRRLSTDRYFRSDPKLVQFRSGEPFE